VLNVKMLVRKRDKLNGNTKSLHKTKQAKSEYNTQSYQVLVQVIVQDKDKLYFKAKLVYTSSNPKQVFGL